MPPSHGVENDARVIGMSPWLPQTTDWLLALAAEPQRALPENFRGAAALLLAVALMTVIFATVWLVLARRRARPEGTRPKKRKPPGASAWSESSRRLRMPPDEEGDRGDTKDIDPSDLSPGDVDLRPPDDDEPGPDGGRGGWRGGR
ncbi:MAG: hypothetical protein KF869_14610 [Phycisphaeraceae bacterium]|nr:hypothetical protein [Phycisphaeraceae bacterium]